MNVNETTRFLEQAISDFQDEAKRSEKRAAMAEAMRKGSIALTDTKIYVLADSRIFISPELIFGRNWGDLFAVQIILEDVAGNPGLADLEFLISQHGPKPLIIAIPLGKDDDAKKAPARIEAIVSRLSKGELLSKYYSSGEYSIHGYGVNTSSYNVTAIDYPQRH